MFEKKLVEKNEIRVMIIRFLHASYRFRDSEINLSKHVRLLRGCLQVDQLCAGKQKHSNYTVRRYHEDLRGYGIPEGTCALASAGDYLLWELNDNDYYTVGYADDIAILIKTENSLGLCKRCHKQHYA
jgi:hypothetical protein